MPVMIEELTVRAVAVVTVEPRLGCGAIAHLSGMTGEVLVAPDGDWDDVRVGFVEPSGRLLLPTRTSSIDAAGQAHGVWIEASTAIPLIAGELVLLGERVQPIGFTLSA